MAKVRTKSQQRKLKYISALDDLSEIPAWIDQVLEKAVHPDPYKRYGELSEFVYELRNPNKAYLGPVTVPLIERNPLLFWQCLVVILVGIILLLLHNKYG